MTTKTLEKPGTMGKTQWIDPKQIDPSPWQPRGFTKGDDTGLKAFAETIRLNGQQQPVRVRPHPDKAGRYQLIDGERRVRACKLGGLSVRAEVANVSDVDALFGTFAANYAREDLTPLEEAEGFALLMTGVGGKTMNQKEIAERLGVTAMTVSRRARLLTLSPKWKRAFANPKSPVYGWPASHMEYLAKFPVVLQETIYEELDLSAKDVTPWRRSDVSKTSLSDLRDYVGEFLHVLDAAPWKLDDEGLCAKAGACTACPKRSSVEPDLFDAVDLDAADGKSGGKTTIADRCLDATCYGKKTEEYVKVRKASLKSEHGNALRFLSDVHEDIEGNVRAAFDFRTCKKSDPGASPVLYVSGIHAGKFEWARPYNYGSKAAASGNGDGKKTATPLKDRRAKLNKRRGLRVVEQLIERIGAAHGKADAFAHVPWCDVVALVAAYGTNDRADRADDTEAPELFEKYRKTAKGSVSAEHEVLLEAFWSTLDVLETRLRGVQHQLKHDDGEAKRAAALLGLDWKALWDDVAVELPEPKSWAKLKADGTPKAG